MQEKQQLTYIQGIRGLAILLIVLFHLLPGICPSGYMGVDVFFVISGYFLLGKHLKGEQEFHLLPFLKQKGQRLLIPYVALIILGLIAAICFFPAVEMMATVPVCKACLMGKANIYLDSLSGNYFSSDTRALPLMHLWYMGVMIQGYAAFALLFFVWRRFRCSRHMRIIHLLFIGGASFATSYLYLLHFPYDYASNTYYWTSARLWEFVLGGLLYSSANKASVAVSRIVSTVTLATFFICAFIPMPNSAAGVLLGALCGALLLLFGKSCWPFLSLENYFFVWLGNISFSLYLIHWPCICYTEYIIGHALSCYDAAWLIIIILPTAYLFHRGVEKPRYSFAALPIAAVTVACVYKSITTTHGFEHYLHQEVNRAIASSTSDVPLPKLPLKSPFWKAASGITPNQYSPHSSPEFLLHELGDTNQKISFVIIGDSHAFDLARGMHLCGIEHEWHGIFLDSYVVPFWGAEFRTPPSIAPGNFFDEKKAGMVLRWLKHHPEIKTVFIAQYWSNRMKPHKMWDGQNVNENILQSRVAQLRQFCRKLNECDKRVVLVTDNPKLSTPSPQRTLSSYLMWHQRKPLPPELSCSRAEYEQLNGLFNEEMDKMENDGLCCVLHRETSFFVADSFVAYAEEKITHRDNHHLSPFGSVLGISHHIEEIQELLTKE